MIDQLFFFVLLFRMNKGLSVEERVLFFSAYQNLMEAKRGSWGVIHAIQLTEMVGSAQYFFVSLALVFVAP